MFELSDQATLHFEDTTPSTVSGSTPVISLFQQDLFGLKMTWPIDWRITRQAAVQVLTGAEGW